MRTEVVHNSNVGCDQLAHEARFRVHPLAVLVFPVERLADVAEPSRDMTPRDGLAGRRGVTHEADRDASLPAARWPHEDDGIAHRDEPGGAVAVGLLVLVQASAREPTLALRYASGREWIRFASATSTSARPCVAHAVQVVGLEACVVAEGAGWFGHVGVGSVESGP